MSSFIVDEKSSLSKDTINELLVRTEAIRPENHYKLVSGDHSEKFFSFSKISQWPRYVSVISGDFIKWIKNNLPGKKIDVILSQATNAHILAFDLARSFNGKMNTRTVEAQTDVNGKTLAILNSVQNIVKGENVLIVGALTTTSKSMKTLVDITRNCKANLIGVCIFASRSEEGLKGLSEYIGKDVPIYVCIKFEWSNIKEEECAEKCMHSEWPLIHSKDVR